MTRLLLTGGSGFVGQWLVRAALERGDDVFAAGVVDPGRSSGILSDEEWRSVRWITADMCVPVDVYSMVNAAQPDAVIHLAGVAFPPDAERDPAATYDVNTLGVVRLLDALVAQRDAGHCDPSIVVVGSALQYGIHDAPEMPLAETAEQRPLTAYAASKAAQEIVALQTARATGIRVVCTRSFNHSGPGQPGDYLLPSLVRRALALGGSNEGTLTLGNDVLRDFLHVSDVAAAYLALAERGRRGEVYNVSSGHGVSVSELAADILRRAGVWADTTSDPSLARATDIPVLVGSSAKLMHDTGWAPRKTHADIIDDLLRSAHAATD